MIDYSLELKSRDIENPQTKRYFKEVYSCYAQGNYRSAVVMLWSVVVTDLLFKLDNLINSDDSANYESIRTEINSERSSNPKSPAWELELVKKMVERSELLDSVDLTNLAHLQQHRHLSAHPVMTNAEVLFEPSKDLVRSHIRHALESVLTKPAIMGQKVFSSFIQDVANCYSDYSPTYTEFERFINARYLSRISLQATNKIFTNLWDFFFFKENSDCDQYSKAIGQALSVVYKSAKSDLRTLIEGDKKSYKIRNFEDKKRMVNCSVFLVKHGELVGMLEDDSISILESFSRTSQLHATLTPFLHEDEKSYVESFKAFDEIIDELAYKSLVTISKSYFDTSSEALTCGITYYCDSGSFDSAHTRFYRFVEPYLTSLSDEHIEVFCEKVMSNRGFGSINQCLGGCPSGQTKICELIISRSLDTAKIDKDFIKEHLDELGLSAGKDENSGNA